MPKGTEILEIFKPFDQKIARELFNLPKDKKIILIGLAYSFQKVKKIPTNKYDMKLDYIVTDKNFI